MTEKHPNQKKKDVYVRKEAFRNMLTHVLRFGNDTLEKSIEVMGICLGDYNTVESVVNIYNAVPIMHGLPVSVGFSKKELELFQQVREKYEVGETIVVGWYISRPSWGLDFTEVTIGNHKFFQNENFPNGICIVFDHSLMGKDGNLGFEVFRLDDYSKTEKYHTVPFEVEIPNSLEYFKWVQKFSEDFQKKNPILIKEIDEFVEPVSGDLREIPRSDDTQVIADTTAESLDLTALDSGFYNGAEKLKKVLDSFSNSQTDPEEQFFSAVLFFDTLLKHEMFDSAIMFLDFAKRYNVAGNELNDRLLMNSYFDLGLSLQKKA